MAKDPAILFYTSDFLTGTFTMTDEQVGRYIKLLCLQHQKGSLTLKDLQFICKGNDPEVFEKFTKDKDGNFYNSTLREKAEQRKAYTESRRKNLTKNSSHMKSHMDSHMDSHMENENVIENKNKNIIKTGIELPFSSKDFLYTWKLLLEQPKWKKKTPAALQASLNKLAKASELEAIEMMTNTISGNWQGIFELNKKTYGQQGVTNINKTGIDALNDAADRVLQSFSTDLTS